jgi:hypothetical protein
MLLREINQLVRAGVTLPSGNNPAYNQAEAKLSALLDTLAKPLKELDELRRRHRFKADENVRVGERITLERLWPSLRAKLWADLGRLDRLVYEYTVVPSADARREVLGACALLVGDAILLADLLGHEAVDLLYSLETELRSGSDEAMRSLPPLSHAVCNQHEVMQELRVEAARERARADKLEQELRNVRRAGH